LKESLRITSLTLSRYNPRSLTYKSLKRVKAKLSKSLWKSQQQDREVERLSLKPPAWMLAPFPSRIKLSPRQKKNRVMKSYSIWWKGLSLRNSDRREKLFQKKKSSKRSLLQSQGLDADCKTNRWKRKRIPKSLKPSLWRVEYLQVSQKAWMSQPWATRTTRVLILMPPLDQKLSRGLVDAED
jgi:hypothetical protein